MVRTRLTCPVLVLALLACLCPTVWAAAPRTESQVPVIPGAVIDQEAAARWTEGQDPEATLIYSIRPLQVRSRYEKVYTVPGPIEDVFKYYQVQLGAKPSGDAAVPSPLDLDPGKGLPVTFDLYPYDSNQRDLVDSSSGTVIRSGKFVRESLSKNRKPLAGGVWLSAVDFNWSHKETNGDVTVFLLHLEDWSFSTDWKSYKTKTLLVVHRETYVSEEETQDATNAQEDQFIAGLAQSMAAQPPTEAILGAPLYPGATFMPEASAGMTMDGSDAMYVYLTLDPVDKVVAFYQQRTGKKADSWAPGKYLLALAGQPPIPDKGLSIEPNTMFGGSAKTVLTFVVKRQ